LPFIETAEAGSLDRRDVDKNIFAALAAFPERVMPVEGRDLSSRQTKGHVLSLCYALALAACPSRFHTDARISARVYLARILWLQGFPEQAVRAAGAVPIGIGEM
jgi:hypothetical protein